MNLGWLMLYGDRYFLNGIFGYLEIWGKGGRVENQVFQLTWKSYFYLWNGCIVTSKYSLVKVSVAFP